MLTEILIWGALLPMAVSAATLWLAWRRPRRQEDAGGPLDPRSWAAALALGLAYLAGNWGLRGGASGDPNARLLLLALVATAVGAFDASLGDRVRQSVRWALSAAIATGAAWLLVAPLVLPQQWSASQVAVRLATVAGAMLVAWLALDRRASREPGPSLAAAVGLLAAGVGAVVLFSGLASTAQAMGPLIAALGVALVASWRRPATARLRGAAAPVSLLLVGHAAVGLLYADMRPASFVLLALAPLALLVDGVPVVRRATAVVGFVVRITAVGAPVAMAVIAAALPYFDASGGGYGDLGGGKGGATVAPRGAQGGGPSGDSEPIAPRQYDEDYGY